MFIPKVSGFNDKDMKDVSLEEIVEFAVEDAIAEFLKSGKKGLKKSIVFAIGLATSQQEAIDKEKSIFLEKK